MRSYSALLVALVFMISCNQAPGNKPATAGDAAPAKDTAIENIICFGNSLTAGYGLEDPLQAWPSLLQHKIDSLHLPYHVINAGNSGETSSGGKERIAWTLKTPCSAFVLELGANDGLRGLPVNQMKQNLQYIIDQVKQKNPAAMIVLTGMQVPPSMGGQYANSFKNAFSELAEKNHIALVPFLLQGVGGIRELNQSDGIHPTAEGHKILARNVWDVLYPLLK